MSYLLRGIGIIIVILIISACGADENTTNGSAKNEETEEDQAETNESNEEKQDSSNNEYPLPILSGWEDEQITFETIGNGTIDMWEGEFTFEGEIEDYFEPYQVALEEMGYEVSVTEDSVGMKSINFSQEINGDNHEGNVLFKYNWVKSSLQHFK